MRAAAVLVVLAALARPAEARGWRGLMDRLDGAAWLHYEVTALHDVEDTGAAGPGAREIVLAGARLHGIFGTGFPILYHVGFDLAVGVTARDAGAAYDVAVFPVGAAVRVGNRTLLAVGAGVGGLGAIGGLDDAVTFPVELTAEAGGRVRVLARVRTAWVAAAKGRHDGAPSAPFGDEVDALLGLRVGKGVEGEWPGGDGYFVAASYRELEGARFVGVTIGYSIDLGTRRRARDLVPVPGEPGVYYVSSDARGEPGGATAAPGGVH